MTYNFKFYNQQIVEKKFHSAKENHVNVSAIGNIDKIIGKQSNTTARYRLYHWKILIVFEDSSLLGTVTIQSLLVQAYGVNSNSLEHVVIYLVNK